MFNVDQIALHSTVVVREEVSKVQTLVLSLALWEINAQSERREEKRRMATGATAMEASSHHCIETLRDAQVFLFGEAPLQLVMFGEIEPNRRSSSNHPRRPRMVIAAPALNGWHVMRSQPIFFLFKNIPYHRSNRYHNMWEVAVPCSSRNLSEMTSTANDCR